MFTVSKKITIRYLLTDLLGIKPLLFIERERMQKWSILWVCLVLSACGSKDDNNPVSNTVYLENDEELQEAINESSVYCMESNCPNNVGKLLFWSNSKEGSGYDFSVCSGTLISSNKFLTNRHCVPQDLRTGSDCTSRMIVQFPNLNDQGIPSENIKCIKVDKVYSEREGEPDLALLTVETSRYTRDGVTLLPNQMNHSKKLYAYTMNPSSGANPFAGYIYKKDCSVSEQNILTGFLRSDSSDALIYGYDCKVIGGNSGSGVFDYRGRLVGVLHSKIDRDKLKRTFNSAGIEYKNLSYMGLFVNISCADILMGREQSRCVHSRINTVSDINQFVDDVKNKSAFAHIDDDSVSAYLGDGLSLVLEYQSSTRSFYRRDSLYKMSRGLKSIFEEDASVDVNQYVWATLN